MSTPTTYYGKGISAVEDIPLPGNFPCLTLQINVTRYASEHRGRAILALRDPGTQVEVWRYEVKTTNWPTVALDLQEAMMKAVHLLEYFQDGTND